MAEPFDLRQFFFPSPQAPIFPSAPYGQPQEAAQETAQAPASDVTAFLQSRLRDWQQHPDPSFAAPHIDRLQSQLADWARFMAGRK